MKNLLNYLLHKLLPVIPDQKYYWMMKTSTGIKWETNGQHTAEEIERFINKPLYRIFFK